MEKTKHLGKSPPKDVEKSTKEGESPVDVASKEAHLLGLNMLLKPIVNKYHADELRLGVKGQSNLEIAGSPRNLLRTLQNGNMKYRYGLSEIEFSVQMRRTCPKTRRPYASLLYIYTGKKLKLCRIGSLTGAVASQRVTEVCEGKLNERRKLSVERNGKSLPDCESDTSSRDESRP
ncbi:unnamed protein product [Bathycoccus prasinos]